ncbi:hypothetical protein [Cedecea sp. P7760]|nr:hypothetical protein [Cedecea sp. P7760]NWC63960.1 hypothetical protein [Cedecea sp. P7760]
MKPINNVPATPGHGAITRRDIFSDRERLYAPLAHSVNACALLGILTS